MPESLAMKLLLYLVLPLAVLGGGAWYIHHQSFAAGEASTQKLWDADKKSRDDATQKLKDYYADKEKEHSDASQQAALALQKANDDHEAALAAARSDYSKRLQSSETRAAIYQRQAAGGSVECTSLASHTAELDRSLEEGRDLVRQLGDTVRLRDQQLLQVGQQLIADRKLYADPEEAKNEDGNH